MAQKRESSSMNKDNVHNYDRDSSLNLFEGHLKNLIKDGDDDP